MYFEFSLFYDAVIVWDCAGWHEIRAQALHSVIPVKDVEYVVQYVPWDV